MTPEEITRGIKAAAEERERRQDRKLFAAAVLIGLAPRLLKKDRVTAAEIVRIGDEVLAALDAPEDKEP